jgi:hypothetical protein
MKSQAW